MVRDFLVLVVTQATDPCPQAKMIVNSRYYSPKQVLSNTGLDGEIVWSLYKATSYVMESLKKVCLPRE